MTDEQKVRKDAFGNPITLCKCPTCGAPAESEEVEGAYDSRTRYKYAEIDNARWFKLFAMPIAELTRCLPSWFADGNQHILDAVGKLVADREQAALSRASATKGPSGVDIALSNP
jgi:hypothetical protein